METEPSEDPQTLTVEEALAYLKNLVQANAATLMKMIADPQTATAAAFIPIQVRLDALTETAFPSGTAKRLSFDLMCEERMEEMFGRVNAMVGGQRKTSSGLTVVGG